MTAKQKAIELINRYNLVVLDTALGGSNIRVKKCALIAVNEILSVNWQSQEDAYYWYSVKKEIENL
jgi:hypothetical protein